ncbi:ATP-dependent DNA helicase [Trichonephila clavata]|uniref:ATP-dependent DNA helicase n=1 Tax=Trichonephila clavata TaxID=2740835 RepID=A0A8X6LY90_TRICU|nr:ATP-dependent DNA helicase [Trichonephila clavata]
MNYNSEKGGEHGMVNNTHLYLKNLRGSAVYWKTAHNELIGQIRGMEPPHYFLTFSWTDLNWFDMRKALLIADKRPNEDPNGLDIYTTHLKDYNVSTMSVHPLLLQYVPCPFEEELLDYFNSARETIQAREEMLREHWEIYRERDRQLEMALNKAHAFELRNREPGSLDHDYIMEIPEEERMNEEQSSNECANERYSLI